MIYFEFNCLHLERLLLDRLHDYRPIWTLQQYHLRNLLGNV